jgi:hypothetical protein
MYWNVLCMLMVHINIKVLCTAVARVLLERPVQKQYVYNIEHYVK